jgi:hypothetical protein
MDKQKLYGPWKGHIHIQGQQLEILINFYEEEGLQATIDIPQQHAYDLPLQRVSVADDSVSFVLETGGSPARFEGAFVGEQLQGSFAQGPATGTFTASRYVEEGNPGGEPDRPEADALDDVVAIEEPAELQVDGKTVHGTLARPRKPAPTPVVLIISGSGPTDRDGNSPLLAGKNDSLRLIAMELARSGIASLRYDKRGIAESRAVAPSEAQLQFDDYVRDAAQWLRQLRQDERFDQVAVLGHSEGSLVGILAAQEADPAAFVSVAGAARPAPELLREQLAGLPTDLRKEAEEALQALEQGEPAGSVSAELAPLFRESVQPYLRSWFCYDPVEEIRKLRMPVLVAHGKRDIQVPVAAAKQLHEAAPSSSLLIVPEMNHVLKDAPADREGNVAAYSNPELPLSNEFATGLVSFLHRAFSQSE